MACVVLVALAFSGDLLDNRAWCLVLGAWCLVLGVVWIFG